MLIKKPTPRIKCYTISLSDEERRKIRKNKKNLSPLRKKFDDLEMRGKIRKMREEIGYPYERGSNRTRRKRML